MPHLILTSVMRKFHQSLHQNETRTVLRRSTCASAWTDVPPHFTRDFLVTPSAYTTQCKTDRSSDQQCTGQCNKDAKFDCHKVVKRTAENEQNTRWSSALRSNLMSVQETTKRFFCAVLHPLLSSAASRYFIKCRSKRTADPWGGLVHLNCDFE